MNFLYRATTGRPAVRPFRRKESSSMQDLRSFQRPARIARRTSRTHVGLGAVLLVLATLTLGGCSGSTSTTGKRVSLATRVVSAPDTESEFTTAEGWRVKLSKAAV